GPDSSSSARAASTAARRLSSDGRRDLVDISVSSSQFSAMAVDIPPRGSKAPAIQVRNLRFGRSASQDRWWAAGDPVATAWFNALSATFPRGETLFIESVKAFRDGAPPALAEEIRAFVRQEVNHTREHLAFNR